MPDMTKEELIAHVETAIGKVNKAKQAETSGMGRSKERDLMEASFDGAHVALKTLLESLQE